MNKIASVIPPVFDFTQAAGKGDTLLSGEGDFGTLLQGALSAQTQQSHPASANQTANPPHSPQGRDTEQTAQSDLARPGMGDTVEGTPVETDKEKGGKVSAIQATQDPDAATAAATVSMAMTQQLPAEAQEQAADTAQAISRTVETAADTASRTAAESIPAVVNPPLSPVQYAQKLAQAMREGNTADTGEEDGMPILSARLTEAGEAAPAGEVPAAPDTAGNTQEHAQQRFDSLIAEKTREITGQADNSEATPALAEEQLPASEVPRQEAETQQRRTGDIPSEWEPEVPDEVLELKDRPALIRAAENNAYRNTRAVDEEIIRTTPLERIVTAAAPLSAELPQPDSLASPDEPPVPGRTYTPPMEQIRAEVTRNLEDRQTEFRMQLHPQELGRIDVRLVTDSGRVTVEIIASSDRTAALLSRTTDGLVASLRSVPGIQLQSVHIVSESQNQYSHPEQGSQMDHSASGGQQQDLESRQGARQGLTGNTHQDNRQDGEEITQVHPHQLLDYAV